MSKKSANIPAADEAILKHPYVEHLHNALSVLASELALQKEKVEELSAELRRLRKLPGKPKIEASKLDEQPKAEKKGGAKEGKRPGSDKRRKKKNLPVDEYREVKLEAPEDGWRFAGYSDYVVQDIKVERSNVCYRREVWISPDGRRHVAVLPAGVQGHDFGPGLRRYIISMYHECHVTQPLVHGHLANLGIDISKGQVNNILNQNVDVSSFADELEEALQAGLLASPELRVDDTSAPHKGGKGFCTCLNSDFFAYFKSTASKSRANFLKVLLGGKEGYPINSAALRYCQEQGLPAKYFEVLRAFEGTVLANDEAFDAFLSLNGISAAHARRTATEGALIGALSANGFDLGILLHSDGARQFRLFVHSQCWKHAERPLKKLIAKGSAQQALLDAKMSGFWGLYRKLKDYKSLPSAEQAQRRAALEKEFDALCAPVKAFDALSAVLGRLKSYKDELLLVLERPIVPLHNNDTERQIREYAKRRKVSGPTRSEAGRLARDTFTSLKKTCRKLGVNFWDYILDRIEHRWDIPPLSEIIWQRARQQAAAC